MNDKFGGQCWKCGRFCVAEDAIFSADKITYRDGDDVFIWKDVIECKPCYARSVAQAVRRECVQCHEVDKIDVCAVCGGGVCGWCATDCDVCGKNICLAACEERIEKDWIWCKNCEREDRETAVDVR